MYRTWIGWQKEVSDDITLNSKIDALLRKKNQLKTEVMYLNYESRKLYSMYSDVRLALGRARFAYHQVDYEMALVDGRLSVIEEIALEQMFSQKTKDLLNTMTPQERKKLIEELELIQDEEDD